MPKPTTRVVNVTSNQVVAEHVEVARSFFSRFLGLMGRKSLPLGHGLWLEPCADIHMFFMRFPIDAVFVDKTGKVLHLEHGIKPWRISKFVRGGRAVLELPAGTIEQAGVTLGDVISLTSQEP
jgi:uncharacterized membrane protein (UPF0127 family)